MNDTIKRLRNDAEYYGEYGKQFLSASDVGTLLTNPAAFKADRPDDKSLAQGRVFHQLILEPDKARDIELAPFSSRSTKGYRDLIESKGIDFLLLEKEFEEAEIWAKTIKKNIDFHDVIYDDKAEYEVPGVGLIMEANWKGKADIVLPNVVIDLKTTRDIQYFSNSARKYNYDAQCFIYQSLFGKPLVFYVVDKATLQLGVFKPTESFVARGRDKVRRAIEVYETYFSPNSTKDVSDYFILEELD